MNIQENRMRIINAIVGVGLLAACGAPPSESSDLNGWELGIAEEPLTIPPSYGWIEGSFTEDAPCQGHTGNCAIPAHKALNFGNVLLLGDCNSSIWQNGLVAAQNHLASSVFPGTGFSFTGPNPVTGVLRCQSHVGNGKFFNVTPTQQVCTVRTGGLLCKVSAAAIDVSGDDIVAACQGAHLNCANVIANVWQDALLHVSGLHYTTIASQATQQNTIAMQGFSSAVLTPTADEIDELTSYVP